MDEYQLLNLMNLSFVSNAMYFVGMALFIWLGFRFANAIYEDGNAPMISKVLSSLYYLCVAGFFYFNGQVAGGILDTYSALLIDIGADSGSRLAAYSENPLGPGKALGVFFVVLILFMQLARTWIKKP